jgi:cyclopropane fatty-acyl-phospholipid synthase-like methyltransferase
VHSNLQVDFPAAVRAAFPAEFDTAWGAVQAVLEDIDGRDLSPLARHSPGLAAFDWSVYLSCSVVRMARALRALKAKVPAPARVLDCGAYFGNFSLMLAGAGYQVDAADAYAGYAPVFDSSIRTMRKRGVEVMELEHALAEIRAGSYDAVLAMGVIEHVPHTPRPFLFALNTMLKPGGWLLLDTPNLAYLYNRLRLERGESIFCPLPAQWTTAIPFEGHHREYTVAEVSWMLAQLQHDPVEIETFNYSYLALTVLQGADLENHRRMEADPTMRELIFSVSRRTQ